jgi:hypothetical protein
MVLQRLPFSIICNICLKSLSRTTAVPPKSFSWSNLSKKCNISLNVLKSFKTLVVYELHPNNQIVEQSNSPSMFIVQYSIVNPSLMGIKNLEWAVLKDVIPENAIANTIRPWDMTKDIIVLCNIYVFRFQQHHQTWVLARDSSDFVSCSLQPTLSWSNLSPFEERSLFLLLPN